jgi:hypothetical protein
MKTIILNFLLVIMIINFIGCKEDTCEEPIQIRNFFVFMNSGGGDFFDSDTRYDPDKITFSCRQLIDIKIINGFHNFELYPGSCESIINFGNGDLDTLKMVWEPGVYGTRNCDDLKKTSYYYNGKLIDTWDFEANPNLFHEIAERNVPDNGKWSNNPIIITIPKQADENELN